MPFIMTLDVSVIVDGIYHVGVYMLKCHDTIFPSEDMPLIWYINNIIWDYSINTTHNRSSAKVVSIIA